jgi:hypothetical protein
VLSASGWQVVLMSTDKVYNKFACSQAQEQEIYLQLIISTGCMRALKFKVYWISDKGWQTVIICFGYAYIELSVRER